MVRSARGERPGRFEHGAEVVGVLFGQVAGIADADDASRRVMPEDEGRKGDRGRNRFQRAGGMLMMISRRTSPRRTRSSCQAIPSTCPDIGLARSEGGEDLVHENSKFVAQQSFEGAAFSRHRHAPPRPASNRNQGQNRRNLADIARGYPDLRPARRQNDGRPRASPHMMWALRSRGLRRS